MNPTRKTPAAFVALGGVMAALAIAVMSIGTLIPSMTYVCPMICMLILQVVLNMCGRRIAWAWYIAVAILGLLLSPDKEAAAAFVFLGYYPILKPWLDRRRFCWIWKAVFFNASVAALYFVLLHLFGMSALVEEFADMSAILLTVLLILGNATLFLLDYLLGMKRLQRMGRNGK